MPWPFVSRNERVRRQAARWLARLNGSPSGSDRAAFERWYGADPAHAEAFERMKALHGASGLLRHTEAARTRTLASSPPIEARSYGYAFAGLAALAAISAVLLNVPGLLPRTANAQVLMYATKVGEIRQVPLPDGSQLTLDTATTVRVELRPDVRHVIVRQGRARLAMSPRDRRPFVVDAGPGRVSGQAATFDVAVEDGCATVRPIAGVVTVNSRASSTPERLSAGQTVVLAATGTRIEPKAAPTSDALWPTGRVDFDNMPLDQVVREANRYDPNHIDLSDGSLARLRVTGTFRAGDTVGLARSLKAAFGLRLDRAANGDWILSPAASGQRR